MDTHIERYLPAFRLQLDKLVVFSDEEWAIFTGYLSVKLLKKKSTLR